MRYRRTHVDAGVLIAVARGKDSVAERDPDREFVSSTFLKLEVLPKAIYHGKQDEMKFYEEFFGAVSYWADKLDNVVEEAHRQARNFGLGPMDSLHIASAVSVGTDELITTEKLNKPIHRVTSIKVISLQV